MERQSICRKTEQWLLLTGLLAFAPAAVRAQPPPPNPGRNAPQPDDLTLAPLLRDILALRSLHELRLSAKDIERLLPPLQDLQRMEAAAQTRAEQQLRAEKEALLLLGPDDPLPPSSSDKIRQEAEQVRLSRDHTWENLSQTIGKDKANSVRRLIEPVPPTPPDGPPKPPKPGREESRENGLPVHPPRPTPPGLRLTLAELIALLEQKLKVMRR